MMACPSHAAGGDLGSARASPVRRPNLAKSGALARRRVGTQFPSPGLSSPEDFTPWTGTFPGLPSTSRLSIAGRSASSVVVRQLHGHHRGTDTYMCTSSLGSQALWQRSGHPWPPSWQAGQRAAHERLGPPVPTC